MLNIIGELIIKHYKRIIILSILVTGISVFLTTKLKLNMQMMDLLPGNEPEVIQYKRALDNYKGIDSITIAIRGNEGNIISYINNIKGEIEALPHVRRIIYKTETDFIRRHGLLLMKPGELDSLSKILKASSLEEFIEGLNHNFEKEYISGEDDRKISKDKQKMLSMFNTIEDFIGLMANDEKDLQKIKDNSNEFLTGKEYMISPDRKMGLMFVKSPLEITDINNIVKLVDSIEGIVKKKQKDHNVYAGVSGVLVLQRDEMHATEKDMTLSSILSLILIMIIFLAGFRLLRYTILALIPLIVGIIVALGITYLTIGSLNAFTAMMGAILIGLGIDYVIHIVALYTEERRKGTDVENSIKLVFSKTARGIVTGSITTAIGFTMFALSSFPGFREFGMVLGIGIICTMLASIIILPSLLLIFGRKVVKQDKGYSRWTALIEKFVLKNPWIAIALIIAFTILSAIKFKDLAFSKDIKDIEPAGLESLAINDEIIERFDFTSDTTIAVSKTLEDAKILKERTEDLDSVSMVESIINYLPHQEDQEKRIKKLRSIKKSISPKIKSTVDLNGIKDELLRLEANLIEVSDLSYIGGEKKIVKKIDEIIKAKIIPDLANALSRHAGSLKTIQETFIGNLKDIVLGSNSQRQIKVEDLPETIRGEYIGKDNSYLTVIYPEGDVWNGNFQDIYLKELDSLNLPLTGTFRLSIKVMNIAGEEGGKILLMVIVVIFIVLLIDFRSFKYAVFAMLPMAMMLVFLTGIMSWFGIKFDYVNIIALPIIIGIGVDDGVHLIHRYLIENNIVPAIRSTGRGILLTSITTTAAFGTMMTARYRGFVSLGLVLVLGIMLAYLLTIILLPALIVIFDKKNNKMEAI